ncbi:MAG: RNA polymerase sigma factor [Patescibacteria group bacterium]
MPENRQEQALFDRAAKGDQIAFGEVYTRLAPAIYRHAYFRVSDSGVAEDVMAETFMKAWEHIAAGKEIENLKGFVYRIAENMIIDHYRTRHRTAAMDEHIERTLDDGVDRVAATQRLLDSEAVRKAVGSLRAEHRDVVVMRYLNDLSYDEIASATGKSKNAVYIAAHRGLKELSKIIKDTQTIVCSPVENV